MLSFFSAAARQLKRERAVPVRGSFVAEALRQRGYFIYPLLSEIASSMFVAGWLMIMAVILSVFLINPETTAAIDHDGEIIVFLLTLAIVLIIGGFFLFAHDGAGELLELSRHLDIPTEQMVHMEKEELRMRAAVRMRAAEMRRAVAAEKEDARASEARIDYNLKRRTFYDYGLLEGPLKGSEAVMRA